MRNKLLDLLGYIILGLNIHYGNYAIAAMVALVMLKEVE
jgi:hypothetical protein